MSSLYIVATPIGNLEDITHRAIATLREVDLILAEDTRHSKLLLQHYEIKTPVTSLHEHNETQKTNWVIQQLKAGKSCALISDSGTPLISDPGYKIVLAAKAENFMVIPIPGVSAVITALCASALPASAFTFLGFMPAKATARTNILQSIIDSDKTIVFYESTHRLLDCLTDMLIILGNDRQISLAKELTKSHEKIITDNIYNVKNWILQDPKHIKGEFVIIISPNKKPKTSEIINTNANELISLLSGELKPRELAKFISALNGGNYKEIYAKIAIKDSKI